MNEDAMNESAKPAPPNAVAVRNESTALTAAPAFDWAPKSLAEAMQLAELLAKSTLVPKDYVDKPGNVLVAIQMGGELGLKAMQAMQNIAVINGRPSLWGDAVLALVRSATDSAGNKILEGIEETFDEAANAAVCKVKRRGQPPCERRFSVADATKAGLLNKDIWKQYTRRMLQMRARSWALRDEFTDVLRGMPIAEEVMDYVPPEKEINPPPAATDAPQSRSDKVLAERSKARLNAVCLAFDGAKNADDLAKAVADAKKLPEGARDTAAEHYRAAVIRLGLTKPTGEIPPGEPPAEGSATPPPESPSTEGMPKFTAEEILAKIEAAASKEQADLAADLVKTLPEAAQVPLWSAYTAKVKSFGVK